MEMDHLEQQLLKMKLSFLPEELILQCLVRLTNDSRYTASLVCREWLHLIESRQFYRLRKQLGHINHLACLLQSHPPAPFSMILKEPPQKMGSLSNSSFSSHVINVFDHVSGKCKTLPPLPNSEIQFDQDSEIVSSEGKLILMNKCDPVNLEHGNSLFVFEFAIGRWRQGKSLPTRKLHFAMAATNDCRVFVAGGYQSEDVDSDSAWMYDVRKDEWTELPQIIQHVQGLSRGVIIGNKFFVQILSMFDLKQSMEIYDFELGEWKQFKVKQMYWTKHNEYFAGIGDGGSMSICSRNDQRCSVKFYNLSLGDRTLFIYYKKEYGELFSMSIMEEGKNVQIELPQQIYGDVYSMCSVEVH